MPSSVENCPGSDLGISSPSLEPHYVEAFRQKLRELGHVDGESIVIEYRWAEGQDSRLPKLAAELVRLKPDVIVTTGTPGTLAAIQATKTIPIVMASSADPVASGLVSSLARPSGNVTGFTILGPALEGKRLELLQTIRGFHASRFSGIRAIQALCPTLKRSGMRAAICGYRWTP
jgi:putative ABC transport system substrate-binding protein